jgi:hypothetical protein
VAASMGTIYKNSYLTIAASWSSDSNGGLFSNQSSTYRPKRISTTSLYVRSVPLDDSQDVLVSDSITTPWDKKKLLKAHWPLLTRAWVFQERQLSARMVHFGENGLLWECHSGHRSEKQPHIILDPPDDIRDKVLQSRGSSPSPWPLAVKQYSRLSLT